MLKAKWRPFFENALDKSSIDLKYVLEWWKDWLRIEQPAESWAWNLSPWKSTVFRSEGNDVEVHYNKFLRFAPARSKTSFSTRFGKKVPQKSKAFVIRRMKKTPTFLGTIFLALEIRSTSILIQNFPFSTGKIHYSGTNLFDWRARFSPRDLDNCSFTVNIFTRVRMNIWAGIQSWQEVLTPKNLGKFHWNFTKLLQYLLKSFL